MNNETEMYDNAIDKVSEIQKLSLVAQNLYQKVLSVFYHPPKTAFGIPAWL